MTLAARTVVVVSVLVLPHDVRAREPDLALPLPLTPPGDATLVVPAPDARGSNLLRARLVLEHAEEPLVVISPEQTSYAAVAAQTTAHAMLSFAVAHRLLFHATIPVVLATDSDAPAASIAELAPAESGVRLGDARVGARARVLGQAGEGWKLAAALEASLPSGASEAYAGDESVGGRALAIGGFHSRDVDYSFAAGFRLRHSERLGGVLPTRVGNAIELGAAVRLPMGRSRTVRLGPELQGVFGIGDGARLLDPRSTVARFLLGVYYRPLVLPVEVGAAFGPDFGQGAGSADYRGLFVLGFSPEMPAPPPDRDRDGVPDSTDVCQGLGGVPSSDPLLHGCPEAPLDTDGDGIPDAFDACPRQPGAPTAERRSHGCPPPPPTPVRVEKAPPAAELVERRIVISEQVKFQTDTALLLPESEAILREVARVLTEHPEIVGLEVAGHTDATGSAEYNRTLSEDRARAVSVWLVAHGVEQSRVQARGYGQERPVGDNATEAGRASNRRVEFHVLRVRDEEAP